tara:strand:+ start:5478 stop:6191 length:714 start_codon:yes stop_codon:yes gene_type:complete
MLPTEKTNPSTDLSNQIIMLYGKPKVGKSTLASQFPGAIFAATEPGLKYLSVHQVQIGDWRDFKTLCMELLESEHDFRTLVVDTVDLLWNQLCDHICRKEGVAHISDFKSFSKGYRMAKDELQRVLTKVANLTTKKGHSMGLVLISHVSETEDDGHLVWAPSISKSPRQVLTSMADVVCFADIYKDSSGEIKRVLRLGPHPNYMTGGRIPNLPDVVSLEYQEFEDAVMNAIKGVSNV